MEAANGRPELSAEEERGLVLAAQSGDTGALNRLIKQYDSYLRTQARRFVRINSAEEDSEQLVQDLVQATWEAALKKLSGFKLKSRFKTWVTQILRNLWQNHVARHPWGKSAVLAEEDVCYGGDGAGKGRVVIVDACNFDKHCFWTDLDKALSKLPKAQRQAFEMFYKEGRSEREIAAKQGTTIDAVKSRLRRARARVCKALQAQHDGLSGLSNADAEKF